MSEDHINSMIILILASHIGIANTTWNSEEDTYILQLSFMFCFQAIIPSCFILFEVSAAQEGVPVFNLHVKGKVETRGCSCAVKNHFSQLQIRPASNQKQNTSVKLVVPVW